MKLIVQKSCFTKNNLCKQIAKYLTCLKNKKTIIFDIHNTIEYTDCTNNNIDQDIFNFIIKNYKNINIILLSYDGNDKRIIHNDNLLNKYHNIFTKIPKIFIKKRKKHHIIACIRILLYNNFKNTKHIMFVDDNEKNINDAKRLNDNKLSIIHYKAHVKKKYIKSNDIVKIDDILNNFMEN